jgi:putative flippase GtrA
MDKETDQSPQNLTKFPTPEKANSVGLPSAFDLFTPSVEIIKKYLVAFLILLGVPIILSVISNGPNTFKSIAMTTQTHTGLVGLAPLSGLIGLIFAPAVIVLQLKAARNQTITWQEALKEGLHQFWRFLGLAILSAIILSVALLLLIVPFFIVLPRIILAPYYLIDKKLGPVEALKASAADYKAHQGTWGIIGVSFLIGLVTIIPLVGRIASTVLSFLYAPASAIRYLQIQKLGGGQKAAPPADVE